MEEGRRGHCRKRVEGGGEGANGCGLSDGRSFELFEDGRASLHKSVRDPSFSLPLSLLQNIREREGRERVRGNFWVRFPNKPGSFLPLSSHPPFCSGGIESFSPP